MSVVLGLNAFHGDASAVVLRDGDLVAAVTEERFTRIKHWAGFPRSAIAWALGAAGSGGLEGVDAVAVARQPRAHLVRKAWLALANLRSLPRTFARVRNVRAVGALGDELAREFGGGAAKRLIVHSVEHHLAHVASAFLCSPFDEAACLSVDGFGDFVSTLSAVGRGSSIVPLDRVYFPHSVGIFYTALSQFLGFPHYGDEYKVMGLSAFGEPCYVDALERVLIRKPAGRFALDLAYFRHLREGVDMTWEGGAPVVGRLFTRRLEGLLGTPRRPEDEVTQRHKDLAASVQAVYEGLLVHLVRHVLATTGLRRLCLAGGCAQNSLANGRLLARTDVDELFVQPAAGDDGTALGAALYVEHVRHGRPRRFVMEHAAYGPAFDEPAVRTALAERLVGSGGADGRHGEVEVRTVADEHELLARTARALADGEVVGWYQGRGEWGPRALGQRSILADPRNPDARESLNVRIKRREPFRPFAPSLPAECVDDWFVGARADPFMTQVFPVRADRRAAIPAVVHADGTGRLQAVTRSANPRYWGLLRAFERVTSIPVLLNTSFNENEPIVNEPGEALDCFLRTRMDRVVLGNVVVRRVGSA